MSLPAEVLSSALHALEEATQGHGSQNQMQKLASWRNQAGTESQGVEIGLYCLHHSANLRTRFFAAVQLEQSLPNCLIRGLLSLEHVWDLRTQLLHYAISLHSSADSRALTAALASVVATVTVAGFALRPADAPESSHAANQPPGFSNAQRHEVLAQIENLLKAPSDPESQTRCAFGLSLVSELIDRFDDRNALGGVKRIGAVKSLSWPERQIAKQVFAEGVLPALTTRLLHLLDALVAHVQEARECVEKAISAFSAALDFHLDKEEEGAGHLPALRLPGVYLAHTSSATDEEEGRAPVSARRLNAAMSSVVLQRPVLSLLERLMAALSSDVAAANGTACDELADEDDAALNSCRDCFVSLAAFARLSMDWANLFGVMLMSLVKQARQPAELYYIARCVRIVLTTIPPVQSVDEQLLLVALVPLLSRIASAACQCASAPVADAIRPYEAEQTAMSVFDELCFALLDLYRGLGHRDPSSLGISETAGTIFSAFLAAKLQAAVSGISDDSDEDVKHNLKDKDISHQTLTAIAALGRLNPTASLGQVDRQLQQLTSRCLNLIHRDAHPSDSAEDLHIREKELTACHEQVHWVILLAGFLLADEGVGETPAVPSTLLELSRSQLRQDDSALSISEHALHLFQSTSLDPATAAATRCSPQVAEDLIWFIGRWSLSFLLTDAAYTGPLSPNLITALNGEGGLRVLHEIFSCFAKATKQFSADQDVLIELGKALSVMSRSRALCTNMARLRTFAEFVGSVLTEGSVFSNAATAALWTGIVRCVANCFELSEGRALLEEVIRVTQNRMQQVLDSPEYKALPTSPLVAPQVLGVLDTYNALISCAQPSIIEPWLDAVSTFCPVLSSCLDIYKNSEDLLTGILECFEGISLALSNGFIVDANDPKAALLAHSLHSAILDTVKVLLQPILNAEMQREMLIRLFDIIGHLSSAAQGTEQSTALAFVQPALEAVAPLVTSESLPFPDFSSSWTKLLRILSRTALHQVDAAANGQQGEKVKEAISESLTIALRSINEDDVMTAVETAESLALAHVQHGVSHLSQVLETVLRVTLETLCFEPCSATLVCDHLLIIQLILLAFSRTNDAHLHQLLGDFVSTHSARAPSLGSTISKLVAILTRSDALVVTPGRGDRLKSAFSAQDEALAGLRDLRLEVRM